MYVSNVCTYNYVLSMYVLVCVRACMRARVSVFLCVRMCACARVRVCLCARVRVCVCVFILLLLLLFEYVIRLHALNRPIVVIHHVSLLND